MTSSENIDTQAQTAEAERSSLVVIRRDFDVDMEWLERKAKLEYRKLRVERSGTTYAVRSLWRMGRRGRRRRGI
jgi:hypothetical protein